jgi:hypothetical protein
MPSTASDISRATQKRREPANIPACKARTPPSATLRFLCLISSEVAGTTTEIHRTVRTDLRSGPTISIHHRSIRDGRPRGARAFIMLGFLLSGGGGWPGGSACRWGDPGCLQPGRRSRTRSLAGLSRLPLVAPRHRLRATGATLRRRSGESVLVVVLAMEM